MVTMDAYWHSVMRLGVIAAVLGLAGLAAWVRWGK